MYNSRINNDINEINEILDKMTSNIVSSSNKIKSIEKSCCKTSLGKGMISVRSYSEFINALKICRIAFVLITTTMCPYCHLFKPVFSKVARLHYNRAIFIEVNADYVPEIAMSFNVYSTPTTLVLHDGRLVDVIVGFVPYASFEAYVRETLNSFGCVSI